MALDSDADIIKGNSNGWVEIKELMLKHFLPEMFEKLKQIKKRIKQYNAK